MYIYIVVDTSTFPLDESPATPHRIPRRPQQQMSSGHLAGEWRYLRVSAVYIRL